VKFTKSEIYNR